MVTNIETEIERESSTREELNELRRKVEKTSKNPEICSNHSFFACLAK